MLSKLINRFSTKSAGLTSAQREFWAENGYLQLPSVLSPDDIQSIHQAVDDQWENRDGNDHIVDVLSGEMAGNIFKMTEVPASIRDGGYKLNNLFARIPAVRRIALSPTIKLALTELLDGEPMICNSLNFERGSQQPYHLDTWYMPPPVQGKMVAAIIALDDIDLKNGPFTYYPGSHKINPYLFSNGLLNIVPAETDQCVAYLNQEIAARELQPTTLSCKAGDVFLWHDNLFHGGAAIADMNLTRKSLVVHYWRKQDIAASEVRSDDHGAYLGRTLRGEFTF